MAAKCNFGGFSTKLMEEDQDFNACLQVAIADETAARESKHVNSTTSPAPAINVMQRGKRNKFSSNSHPNRI